MALLWETETVQTGSFRRYSARTSVPYLREGRASVELTWRILAHLGQQPEIRFSAQVYQRVGRERYAHATANLNLLTEDDRREIVVHWNRAAELLVVWMKEYGVEVA